MNDLADQSPAGISVGGGGHGDIGEEQGGGEGEEKFAS